LLDVSENEEAMRIKLQSCLDTLGELKVDSNKVLLVLNKIDLVDSQRARTIEEEALFKDLSVVKISAVSGIGLHQLRTRILSSTQGRKSYHSAEPAPPIRQAST
ncbi:MAG: hypothetical protein OK454_09310, partial [Thaumarchaeota archaeon]|nr:hypothetical protein [Nitrososphaerota archaeon]